MPKVIIDASKAESGFSNYTGPTPPNGLYKARVQSAWWGPSSKGTPMLTATLVFRAKSEAKQKYDGYTIWVRITNAPNMLWRMQQLFIALGQPQKAAIDISDKDGAFGKVVTHIGRAQVGKAELLVKTKTEMYQGAERLAVDTLSPLPSTVAEDYDEGDETSFDEAQSMMDNWQTSDEQTPDDPWGSGGFEASDEEPPF